MEQQVLGRNDGAVHPAEPARKPWSAPVLTVSSVETVTRAGSITEMDPTEGVGS